MALKIPRCARCSAVRERETQIAAGKEQGMIFKKHLCGDCGKELASRSERRQTINDGAGFPHSG